MISDKNTSEMTNERVVMFVGSNLFALGNAFVGGASAAQRQTDTKTKRR